MGNEVTKAEKRGLSRREMLKATFALAFGSVAYSYVGELLHPEELAAQTVSPLSDFTDEEYLTVKSIAGTIIPADENPGADEANVVEPILFTVSQRGAEVVQLFKMGLEAVNNLSLGWYSKPFYQLDEAGRQTILGTVSVHPQFAEFWKSIRSLTVLYFYSNPLGYLPIGLPGPVPDDTFADADQKGCFNENR